MTRTRAGLILAGLALARIARAQEPLAAAPPPPPPALPTAAEERAIAEEILQAQAEATTEERSRLQFYGFADFSYWQPLQKSSPWFQYLPKYPDFVMGNFNLYADANIAPRWRSLAEIRFLYSPMGSTTAPDASGHQSVVDTTIEDPAEPGRMMSWGGISLVRAWIEYEAHPLLIVRAGHFLSPFGVWNVDHSSVVVIGVRQPFIVRSQWFPESQTGLEIYGATDVASLRVGYHLTLSNGNGLAEAVRDFDSQKAVGGRLFVSHAGPLEGAVGGSIYYGRRSILHYQYSLDPNTHLPMRNEVFDEKSDDLAVAADLRVAYHGLHFQSEFIHQQHKHPEGSRAAAGVVPGAYLPDFISWGAYGLLGYRIARWHLMPYFTLEYLRENGSGGVELVAGHFGNPLIVYTGLNFRPIPNIVFKLELQDGHFLDAAPGSWGEHSFNALEAQVAWAF